MSTTTTTLGQRATQATTTAAPAATSEAPRSARCQADTTPSRRASLPPLLPRRARPRHPAGPHQDVATPPLTRCPALGTATATNTAHRKLSPEYTRRLQQPDYNAARRRKDQP